MRTLTEQIVNNYRERIERSRRSVEKEDYVAKASIINLMLLSFYNNKSKFYLGISNLRISHPANSIKVIVDCKSFFDRK
jgi:hypothetical protein